MHVSTVPRAVSRAPPVCQFWWIYNPPGLNWGFSIPVPSRHLGSPHGVADCKSAGYLAAGLQIQPNEDYE